MIENLAEARDGFDRGVFFHVPIGAIFQLDHGNEPIARQGVLGHLTVSWLKNVQREDAMREENDLRQREEPANALKTPQFLIRVHGLPPRQTTNPLFAGNSIMMHPARGGGSDWVNPRRSRCVRRGASASLKTMVLEGVPLMLAIVF
jgi:hypothetical protein